MTDSPKPQTARTWILGWMPPFSDMKTPPLDTFLCSVKGPRVTYGDQTEVIEASALDALKAENAELNKRIEEIEHGGYSNFGLAAERDQLRKELSIANDLIYIYADDGYIASQKSLCAELAKAQARIEELESPNYVQAMTAAMRTAGDINKKLHAQLKSARETLENIKNDHCGCWSDCRCGGDRKNKTAAKWLEENP